MKKSLKVNKINDLENKPVINSMLARTIIGFFMIIVFVIIITLDKSFLIGLVCIININLTYEMIMLTRKTGFSYVINPLVIIFVSVINFLQHAYSALIMAFPYSRKFLPIVRFRIWSYFSYVLFFVYFVKSLKKKCLKRQFEILLAIHVVPYLTGTTCRFAIMNIIQGKYYLVMPASVVITNDIGAYFFGKFFGRTSLFSLSPNKTIEGFIGGAISSLVVSLIFSYLKLNQNFLPDEIDGYIKSDYILPFVYYRIPQVYIMSLYFFIGSSILAPFAGFLASAVKRFYRTKDFSNVFLIHGGFTDRFDCHIMMIWLTYFFLKLLKGAKISQAQAITHYLIENFTDEEVLEIIKTLNSKLN